MSEIKKGDLVMVVRGVPCCGRTDKLGSVFVVLEGRVTPNVTCAYCGASLPHGDVSVMCNDGHARQRYRLKKIDPPATGDEVSTRVTKKQPVSA